MNIESLESYFETLATNNKAIAHTANDKRFSTLTMQEVLNGMQKGLKGIFMHLDLPEIRPVDLLSDNTRKVYDCGIILTDVVKLGSLEEEKEAMRNLEPVVDQIISKLLNDRKKFVLNHLDVNSFRVVPVGPIFDNRYGWRINFQLNEPQSYVLDESKWENETRFKI